MAGGKETPRQKMIGMMYLVLTALLALQVSNAVLEKFALINDALETLAAQTNEKNESQLKAIAAAVTPQAKDSVKLAYANAQKVRELTTKTVADLQKLKAEFLAIAESTGIDEKFINNHGSKVAYTMMDPRTTKGEEYEELLNGFATELEKLAMGSKFDKLAKAPAEMKEFANDKKNANKDFIEFTFENTPPIAAYASVTEMESQVYAYESVALQNLAEIADAGTLKFDNVLPMIIPKSSTVVAGSVYEAKMYIGASNSALNPVMFQDGKSLPIAQDAQGIKFGQVKFVAPAGGYNKDGIAERTFKALIQVKGTDYPAEVPYNVVAPTVKITSGALSKLYINCGNELNVEVPGLGTDFVPGYNAGTEAEVIKGAKLGQITLIPKSKAKVKLAVSNAGNPIETVTFDVRTAPPPLISVKAGGRDLNAKDGVSKNAIAQMTIKATADDDFANTVPKDAEFRIRKGRVFLRKGTNLGQPIEFTGETLNLAAFAQTAKPGDVLSFELETVTRRTFKGENEPVILTPNIKYISIPISQ
jgi:gliding motility-associated protein GldM